MMNIIRQVANPLSQPALGSFTYLNRDCSKIPDNSDNEQRLLLSVSINDSCNLQCPQCVESNYKRGEENYTLLKERLDELPPKSVIWFSIAGKEPTLSPKRVVETARIARNKAHRTIIMTNGIELTPKLQERLNGDIDYVDVSVDGVTTEDAYKHMSDKLKGNLLAAAKRFRKVSILTTLINDDSENWRKVGDLTDRVADIFSEKVAHSVGFYLGWPSDEKLLSEEQVLESLRQLTTRDFKVTIQIPPMYSRFLPAIFKEFGIEPKSKRYDSATGIPSYDLNGHTLIPLSHLETPLYGLRAEIDGNVYFGCSHLMLSGDTTKFAVGNLKRNSLLDIAQRIMNGESSLINSVSEVQPECYESPCFELCRGGDRLGGYIHTGRAIDPFCQLEGNCSR